MPNGNDESTINESGLNQMKVEILRAEQKNLNTGEKTNEAMVDLIRKTIIRIADKTY